MQTLPAHKTTILTRQKHKARRDLARLPWPSHRRPAKLIHGITLHRARDQRRPHGPRTDAIDADAEGDLLVAEAAGEGDDGAFAAGVVEQVGAADVGVYRGVVDDGVAGFHVFEGVFGHVEVGVDVCVEGFEPLVSMVGGGLALDVRWWRETRGKMYSESSRMPLVMFWYAALLTRMLMVPISETAVSTTFLQFSCFLRSVDMR